MARTEEGFESGFQQERPRGICGFGLADRTSGPQSPEN